MSAQNRTKKIEWRARLAAKAQHRIIQPKKPLHRTVRRAKNAVRAHYKDNPCTDVQYA
jgi:hypothetical protein